MQIRYFSFQFLISGRLNIFTLTGNRKVLFAINLIILLSFFLIISCDSGKNSSGGSDFIEICENDPDAELCDQQYALCIAASCDPETIDGNNIECGSCDSDDGSCGYCYVFEGLSCSFESPCSELEPSGNTVFSTYSDELSFSFGFSALECNQVQPMQANCMDAPCTLTGEMVPLTDEFGETLFVPTAICNCQLINSDSPSGTLGGQCNTDNCSAIWSTSSEIRGRVLDMVPQCTD